MPISDYTPGLADVGAIVLARTVDDQGSEIGTFSPATRPTDAQAAILIQEALGEAYPVLGENIPDDPTPGGDPNAIRNSAKRIVALRAAALVEQSYYPEQVARGVSPYAQIQQSFNDGLKRIAQAIEAAESGDTPGEDSGSLQPQFGFPEDQGGMVGWGTVW